MKRFQSVRSIEDLGLEQLRDLLRDFRWIRFQPEDEADFRRLYHRNLVPVVRLGLLVSVVFHLTLSVVDWVLLPAEIAQDTTGLRLSLVLPAAAIIFGATLLPGASRIYPWIALVFSAVLGLVTLGAGFREEAHGLASQLPAFLGTLVYIYLFLGMRLKWALWAAVPLTLAYGAFAIDENTREWASTAVYLAFTNLLGAAGCYLLEVMFRREYLEGRLLHILAGRDALTRIHNRRMFDDHYGRVWAQAAREKKRVGLIIADIDYFKAYNDHYGHQEGDGTLVEVAQCLKRCARRPLDFVARYGGEEFVLVLYDPERGYTETLCERIHNEVAGLEIPHARSQVSGRVTISLGAAVVRPAADADPEEGLRTADEALYEAKAQGRDRTVAVVTAAAMEKTGFFEKADWERHLASPAPV